MIHHLVLMISFWKTTHIIELLEISHFVYQIFLHGVRIITINIRVIMSFYLLVNRYCNQNNIFW